MTLDRRWSRVAGALGMVVLSLAARAQTVTVEPVCAGVGGAVQIVGGGRPGCVYVVVVSGTVRVVDTVQRALLATPLLDLGAVVDNRGDGGLLSLALDPQFATNRYAYVYYNLRPDHRARLSRFTVAPDGLSVVSGSEQVVLEYPRPIGHNAGWIGFSPVDGYLYVSSGDGGTGASPDPENAAQDLTEQWKGKILRIDPAGDDFPGDATRNYRVPPDNPFVGTPGDDEIWAYGVRNGWRCSFDAAGELWIGDVGQDGWEEVDVDPARPPGGRNYGWRCLEGPDCTGLNGCPCPPGATPPLYAYDHSEGCSITGGMVYHGPAAPALDGAYVFSDWCTGGLRALRRGPQVTVEDLAGVVAGSAGVSAIAGFGVDETGELYFASLFSGVLYRLAPMPPPPACDPDFTCDGNADQDDVSALVNAIASADYAAICVDPDFSGDGNVDQDDVAALISVIAGGGCP